jgi:hypothetical protein
MLPVGFLRLIKTNNAITQKAGEAKMLISKSTLSRNSLAGEVRSWLRDIRELIVTLSV